MTRPFTDLACELRDGLPVCVNDFSECSDSREVGLPCSWCSERSCLLAVRRYVAIGEAAREEGTSNSASVYFALRDANANLEDA